MEIPIKRPVSRRAVSERINRKLYKQNKKLVKNPPRNVPLYGVYMVIDLGTNMVDRHPINDIESFAREMGCIEAWEIVEND